MSLQERLKNLRPYVIGLRFLKEMPVIDVNIKEGWRLLEHDKISVKKSEKVKNYLMFYSEDPSLDIDDILNFVEACIDFNKEIEAKELLYKTYLDTLRNIFNSTSYEELKNLQFTFPNKIKETQEEEI